jgi:hypothetical protein
LTGPSLATNGREEINVRVAHSCARKTRDWDARHGQAPSHVTKVLASSVAPIDKRANQAQTPLRAGLLKEFQPFAV